jgi:hypothetical protein
VKQSHADACGKKCHAMRSGTLNKSGEKNMQPPNEVLCSLFVPSAVVLGLILTVVLQFAFNGDDF